MNYQPKCCDALRLGSKGVLNITAAAWTAGFQWWRSGDITRTQNVSEYMLVLAYAWFRPVVFSFFLFFYLLFLAYSQPSQIGRLPYFHTWCGLSANLGCIQV